MASSTMRIQQLSLFYTTNILWSYLLQTCGFLKSSSKSNFLPILHTQNTRSQSCFHLRRFHRLFLTPFICSNHSRYYRPLASLTILMQLLSSSFVNQKRSGLHTKYSIILRCFLLSLPHTIYTSEDLQVLLTFGLFNYSNKFKLFPFTQNIQLSSSYESILVVDFQVSWLSRLINLPTSELSGINWLRWCIHKDSETRNLLSFFFKTGFRPIFAKLSFTC